MAEEEANKGMMAGEAVDVAAFDPTKKKKKKKVVIQDPPQESITEELTKSTENLTLSEEQPTNPEEDEKAKLVKEAEEDYPYEDLLGRLVKALRENNPELAGDRRKTVMRPPQILREGTKKTVFVNFMDLCRSMHRQPDHVMEYLLAEMGTTGALDGQQRVVVKGRFAPKNFEGILRRYMNEYVICNACKSPDSVLSKENRIYFLRCEKCGASRSVEPIKTGYVARIGSRKKAAEKA